MHQAFFWFCVVALVSRSLSKQFLVLSGTTLVVANDERRFLSLEQLASSNTQRHVLLESTGRNTPPPSLWLR